MISNVPSLVGLDLGELHASADTVERLGTVVADLVALPDGDGAEHALRRVLDPEQVVHEGAVAVLEHVQRDGDAREQHGVQGKHRQRVGHVHNLA